MHILLGCFKPGKVAPVVVGVVVVVVVVLLLLLLLLLWWCCCCCCGGGGGGGGGVVVVVVAVLLFFLLFYFRCLDISSEVWGLDFRKNHPPYEQGISPKMTTPIEHCSKPWFFV